MSTAPLHKELASGRWRVLSLAEQMGNIGSEVGRAGRAQGRDAARFHGAVDRALELFDFTLADTRWRGRLREIGRAYEVFCDAVLGGIEYGSSLADLERYFMQFAIAARRKKFIKMKQITFRIKPNQFLKEEIVRAAKEHGIKAGVLLSIVGGLENAVLRMAGATPDRQDVKDFNGPFEIVSGTGTISQDGCHIHISVSDQEGKVIGGHLKDGCRVHLTAEIMIGVFDDVSYRRVYDAETGFKELQISHE